MTENPRKILMVTSEATPFAKTGGLADAVSALSSQLSIMGHDVRVVMPRYYSIPKDVLTPIKGPLGVPLGGSEEWSAVFETELIDSGTPVYLLDHEGYFGRDGIYGPSPAEAFMDNAERFNFFCRAVFQLCRKIEWIPDIFHCHDWVAGPVSLYLKSLESQGEFAGSVSVMTIHNLGYQGNFGEDKASVFPLPRIEISRRFGFHNGQLNYLKMGIENAEIVTTVSPTYAHEIQTPEYGFGLDGALRYRSHDLFGVLNGVDYSEWNPENDKYIPHNFSSDNLEGKVKNKLELQKRFGLEQDPEIPVIGIVSRMVEQKGFGDLCGPGHGSLFSLCSDMKLQFVIVGSGESWVESELESLSSRLSNLGLYLGYSNELAHLVEAGSDFFLMPSQYEPCGLNQLYSLRYGTLPIVRKTGGLADTVENYNEDTVEGCGFVFEKLSPRAIYDTVGWAVYTWYNRREDISLMRSRAMERIFSWEKSAEKYLEMYQWAQDRKQGFFP